MSDDPIDAVRSFVDAVVWGDHLTVWALLGLRGRETALAVAADGGLDAVAARRIAEGLADPAERDGFLTALVRGLRRDLGDAELDSLVVRRAPASERIQIVRPSPLPVDDPMWVVAEAEVVRQADGWRIDSLLPIRSRR